MLELNDEEKQLVIEGLNLQLDEINWQFKERKIKPEIKEEHFSYWNNKLIVIKQLLEKLNDGNYVRYYGYLLLIRFCIKNVL
jgi:hypothetical protein